MAAEFRPQEDGDVDYESIVAIARATEPDDYVSVSEIRDWDETQRRASRLCARWFAYVNDTMVGFSYVGESPWLERMVIVRVMVHPEHQQRGYGRTLLQHAESTALDHGDDRLLGWTQETRPRDMRFMEQAGFREIDREWRSTLDLDRFDPTTWQETTDRVAASGIRIVSVAAHSEDHPGWNRDLHRLYVELEADVPSKFPILEVPFDDFEEVILGRRFLADGFLLAMDGDQMVGLTEPLLVDDEPTAIAQAMTGVRPEYRGRGIATALKAASAIWAVGRGYTSIRTNNAQSNVAMLAVNDRLGFERDHATIEYLKRL
ncbi:MAG: GNAT family N-acetyltransferase [Actinomycetota bacterium]|nr:GNAT family N-acetyltransferase [Actinomycetota bacterium]